ncbi:hypothetical protein HKX42_04190 [Salinisphaera sp. USBA-960]|uniref:hypothetical protein n=1 Tax=Salinisphaera orenii TaxID=856731 RepID=UPI000DBE5FCE|nr:hypothetical protein [Salifodinibacter halophilus]NNC26075.1 hypothetical protein [Salifodinibacter halophilus]
MDERFSAAIDNEASHDEVAMAIDAAIADRAVRDCWTRQYWLQTTLQHPNETPVSHLDIGFADRVMTAIEADQGSTSAPPETERTIDFESKRRVRRGDRGSGRGGWRTSLGAAAAASVVGFVVYAYAPLGGQHLVPSNDTGHSTSPVAEKTSGGGATQTVANTSASPSSDRSRSGRTRRESGHWSVSDPDLRRELNGYLVEHNGVSRNFGLSASAASLVQATAYRTQTHQ